MTNYNHDRLDYYDKIQADAMACWQAMNGSLDNLMPLVWTKQQDKWNQTALKFKEVVTALREIYAKVERRIGDDEDLPDWLRDEVSAVENEQAKLSDSEQDILRFFDDKLNKRITEMTASLNAYSLEIDRIKARLEKLEARATLSDMCVQDVVLLYTNGIVTQDEVRDMCRLPTQEEVRKRITDGR